jgi:hypothetical protein
MTSQLSSKPAIIADYFAKIWVRMIKRNGALVEEALRKMGAGEYRSEDYFQTLTQMVDGNLSDGSEVAEAVAAGPGFKVASNVVRSSAYGVPPSSCQYQVTLTSPLTRGFGDELPHDRVSFESVQGDDKTHCPTGLLLSGAEKFHLVVNRTDLQSGSYVATAVVTPMTNAADNADKIPVDVTIEL